ncbi:MAG: shikimate dehydrogenase [Pseudonocardia sp.]|nr:shikimate dehydrogenase [Pseudonocardia sp.]
MTVTGQTRLAAVVGDPVRHSLSPVMHNAGFAAVGLDWLFVALPVAAADGARAFDAMRVLGFEGLSVTMPHKATAADACDEVRGDAALLHSVNCVSRGDGGALVGESTDGEGFLRSLRDGGHDVAGMRALVIGAGGAGRAVALALARSGAEVIVAARRAAAAQEVVGIVRGATEDSGARRGPGPRPFALVEWNELGATAGSCDLVVNATPIGMAATGSESLPVAASALHAGQVVADLVYQPRQTPLLAAAGAAGAATVEGIGMLVHQGAIAFERWTGVDAPVDVMRAAALTALA